MEEHLSYSYHFSMVLFLEDKYLEHFLMRVEFKYAGKIEGRVKLTTLVND